MGSGRRKLRFDCANDQTGRLHVLPPARTVVQASGAIFEPAFPAAFGLPISQALRRQGGATIGSFFADSENWRPIRLQLAVQNGSFYLHDFACIHFAAGHRSALRRLPSSSSFHSLRHLTSSAHGYPLLAEQLSAGSGFLKKSVWLLLPAQPEALPGEHRSGGHDLRGFSGVSESWRLVFWRPRGRLKP
jgi:hypothetical protein